MPTEEPRKYVIGVKLSKNIFNQLKGTVKHAAISFGLEENVCTISSISLSISYHTHFNHLEIIDRYILRVLIVYSQT